MKELVGKRFELSEVVGPDGDIWSITLISDDEVVRLEPDTNTGSIRASIEQLSDPLSEEVHTDVFGGNFVAQ